MTTASRACFVSGMANPEAAGTGVSESVGDYLKAIWILGEDESVSTRDLAERLGVSAPSVSEMLSRLHELGLVHHERYYGATLTAEGTGIALRLVRRHRLIETLMVEHLGYSWDEVHAEAEVLEHAVSDRFVERLDALLGRPTHDPHGDPIPSAEGTLPQTPSRRLSRAAPGSRFRISRLLTQDSEHLAELAERGLKPGVVVEVAAVEEPAAEEDIPPGITLVTAVGRVSLSGRLADLIRGETVE